MERAHDRVAPGKSFARALDVELGSEDDDGRRLLKLQKRF